MSGIYTFPDNSESLDSTAVLVEENVVWDHNSEEDDDQVVVGYTSTSDSILTDTINESFVTAHEDDSTTQYFSVLETSSETILGEMNMTMDTSKECVEETVEFTDGDDVESEGVTNVAGNDIMLYNVPGDGLYGIQLAEDEHGNLQKYQFKLRQTEDGQLEAVTDSIQILSVDSDEQSSQELPEHPTEVPTSTDNTLPSQSPASATLFVKQEYGLHSEEHPMADENEIDSPDGLQINDDDSALSFEEQCDIETKQGILENNFTHLQKQEVIEDASSGHLFDELHEEEETNVEGESEHVFLNEHVESEHISEDHQGTEIRNERNEHYENVFVEESRIDEAFVEDEVPPLNFPDENVMQTNHITNESDAEDYDVVEGLHVTADTEIETINNVYDVPDKQISPLKQPISKLQNTSILKNALRNNYPKETNGVSKSNLIMMHQNEKENVSNVQLMYKYQKPNPRSILKSSFPLLEENNKDENEVRPVDRRFIRGRMTSQARMLQNFIAKTTIIHAPVRQERLPRKQTIKPVTRQDEEIIVQEVVVSSNGFIETSEDGVLKSKEPLQPTVFLNVSDSDDEYDLARRTKRKRRRNKSKSKTITIEDSGDENVSEASVIELSDTTDTDDTVKDTPETDKDQSKTEKLSAVGKKRGRPSKPNKTNEETNKLEIKCLKCSKTFPSQGSLKTHMQYHNFKETTLKTTKTTIENKFTCKHCKATFRSLLLLNKHLSDHKSLGCTICKKIFTTAMELSAHRKIHLKEQMCISTVAEKHSPKVVRKTLLKSPPKIFKCDVCSRAFKDAVKLEVHSKTHKKFTCANCGANFVSKVVLDLHVRENCVKIKAPAKSNLGFKVKKSIISSPKKLRESNVYKTPAVSLDKSTFENLKCERCNGSFANYRSLFKHKVAEHGLETPDKNIFKRNVQKLCKPRAVHGGVPSKSVLMNTYSSIRRKVAES